MQYVYCTTLVKHCQVIYCLVDPTGIEPVSPSSEHGILSVELRTGLVPAEGIEPSQER